MTFTAARDNYSYMINVIISFYNNRFYLEVVHKWRNAVFNHFRHPSITLLSTQALILPSQNHLPPPQDPWHRLRTTPLILLRSTYVDILRSKAMLLLLLMLFRFGIWFHWIFPKVFVRDHLHISSSTNANVTIDQSNWVHS